MATIREKRRQIGVRTNRFGGLIRNEGVRVSLELLASGVPWTAQQLAEYTGSDAGNVYRWLKRNPQLFAITAYRRQGNSRKPAALWTLRHLAEKSWRPA